MPTNIWNPSHACLLNSAQSFPPSLFSVSRETQTAVKHLQNICSLWDKISSFNSVPPLRGCKTQQSGQCSELWGAYCGAAPKQFLYGGFKVFLQVLWMQEEFSWCCAFSCWHTARSSRPPQREEMAKKVGLDINLTLNMKTMSLLVKSLNNFNR